MVLVSIVASRHSILDVEGAQALESSSPAFEGSGLFL